ncbi:MAG TPA: SUMF1/EgtB/PvdO family nonheme iron enzyme [Polyangiaceae bacterium]
MIWNSRFVLPGLLGWASLAACSSPPFTGAEPSQAAEGGSASSGGLIGGASGPAAGGVGSNGSASGTAGSGATSGSAAGGLSASGAQGIAGNAPLAGDSGLGPCPSLSGEPMVRAGTFCIDANEVTVDNYQAFLASPPATPTLPECSWNASYKPACAFATGVAGQVVRCVDWCDAYEYCHSVGKRLCGAIAGGASPYGEAGNDASNQWYSACSGTSGSAYPYGDTYDPKACVGADAGHSGALVISSASTCEGGYPGLTDMSGNVAEWVDSCSSKNGEQDHCRLRGGSVQSTSDQLTCTTVIATERNLTSQTIGFRCCSD